MTGLTHMAIGAALTGAVVVTTPVLSQASHRDLSPAPRQAIDVSDPLGSCLRPNSPQQWLHGIGNGLEPVSGTPWSERSSILPRIADDGGDGATGSPFAPEQPDVHALIADGGEMTR